MNHNLKSGNTKSCGCLQRELTSKARFIDIKGQRFSKWTVIRRSYPNAKWGQTNWLCKCDCGKEKIVQGNNLTAGKTKCCGCLRYNKLKLGLSNMRSSILEYKRGAKIRGYNYKLTEEQFKELTQRDCYYCGTKPKNIRNQKGSNGGYIYNGIDRIDSSKDYTIDNVVPCCKMCNIAKHNYTLEEFKDWIKKVYIKLWR